MRHIAAACYMRLRRLGRRHAHFRFRCIGPFRTAYHLLGRAELVAAHISAAMAYPR